MTCLNNVSIIPYRNNSHYFYVTDFMLTIMNQVFVFRQFLEYLCKFVKIKEKLYLTKFSYRKLQYRFNVPCTIKHLFIFFYIYIFREIVYNYGSK